MGRFVKKILMMVMLFAFTYLAAVVFDCVLVGNQYRNLYLASIIDKTDRLKSLESPKIILVGNSNVNFGFDSAMLEKEMNMPVVNLGLHGALGNTFHEGMAMFNVSEGDFVIICHSDYSEKDIIPDPTVAWITLEHHYDLYPIIRARDMPRMMIYLPKYIFKSGILWLQGEPNNNMDNVDVNDVYSLAAFNKYGDIGVYRQYKNYKPNETDIKAPEIKKECVQRLNKLNGRIQEKGATMLVAGYPIIVGDNEPEIDTYNEFEQELRDFLDCDVISHYTDYFIPYNMFYDTYLHLTTEGAKYRTELLIRDLKRWEVE